jgi:hypothetical protein
MNQEEFITKMLAAKTDAERQQLAKDYAASAAEKAVAKVVTRSRNTNRCKVVEKDEDFYGPFPRIIEETSIKENAVEKGICRYEYVVSHPLVALCPHCFQDVAFEEYHLSGGKVFRCPSCGYTDKIKPCGCSNDCIAISGKCFKRHVPRGLHIPEDWFTQHPIENAFKNNTQAPIYFSPNTQTHLVKL